MLTLMDLLKARKIDEAQLLAEAAARYWQYDAAMLSAIGSFFLREGMSSIAAQYLNQSLSIRKRQQEPAEVTLTNEDLEYLDEQEAELIEEEYDFLEEELSSIPQRYPSDRTKSTGEQVSDTSPEPQQHESKPRPTLSLHKSSRTTIQDDKSSESGVEIRYKRNAMPPTDESTSDTSPTESPDGGSELVSAETVPSSTTFYVSGVSDPDAFNHFPDEESNQPEPEQDTSNQALTPEDIDLPSVLEEDEYEDAAEESDLDADDSEVYETSDPSEFDDPEDIDAFDEEVFGPEEEWLGDDEFDADFYESLVDESDYPPEIENTDGITRRERARQVAQDVLFYSDWQQTRSNLEALTDIFEEYGWSKTKQSIRQAIDLGLSLEQIITARDLRHFWQNNERFWMTFTSVSNFDPYTQPAYYNLSWPQALAFVSYNGCLLSLAELEHYLEDEFDYWYGHSVLRRAFPAFLKYLYFRRSDLAFQAMADIGEYGIGSLATKDAFDDSEYHNLLHPETKRLEQMGIQVENFSAFKPTYHTKRVKYPEK